MEQESKAERWFGNFITLMCYILFVVPFFFAAAALVVFVIWFTWTYVTDVLL